NMTLAVATNNPMAIAETYVRQHMRLICPGDTVAIGLDCGGKPNLDLPYFCVRRGSGGVLSKIGSQMTRWRTGYGAALSLAEEKRLLEFLGDHGVSAVLAEFGTTGAALREVCTKIDLPLFVNFHGYDATVLPKRHDIRHAYRRLARDASGFICGSEHFSAILQRIGIPQKKISVIPCGIEIDDFRCDPQRSQDRVIAVGRLTPKKRPDLTIRAFSLALKKHPRLRMDLIGEGGERARCEAIVTELGLGGSVRLLGACSHAEVKKNLASASIFAQHSVTAENGDQESQGISLLEAMASSLPVVCTDHNGFSETVIDGETGLLSPEHNVEAMAANLCKLVEAPESAIHLGQEGRKRVEQYYRADNLAERLRSLIFANHATQSEIELLQSGAHS
ncbi:MAG: glycosyltransferase family 4 protein, partial [Pseudomonadota bacterium]